MRGDTVLAAFVEADSAGRPRTVLSRIEARHAAQSYHLDPNRRAALFDRLAGRGQAWMTATESGLFDGIADASRFHVDAGTISPA